MAQDPIAALKIILVWLVCCLLGGGMVAFLEGRSSGRRAFWSLFAIGGLIAGSQLLRLRWLPLLAVPYALALVLWLRQRRL